MPPRRPTQTSSARSLQPIPSSGGSARGGASALANQKGPNVSHTLNPHPVVPSPVSHLNQPSKKVTQLSSSVDKQKELLAKLQADKIRTEIELRENAGLMQDKIQTLADERSNIEKLIL